jgi:hypothetical protein
LRKLLMHVALPRETQQIDRVIEAFAGRYRQCNPSLFTFDGERLISRSRINVHKALSCRSPLHPSFQLNHASHRRFQQVQ